MYVTHHVLIFLTTCLRALPFLSELVAPPQIKCACEKRPARHLLTQAATQRCGIRGILGGQNPSKFCLLRSGRVRHAVCPHLGSLGSLFSKMTAGGDRRHRPLTPPSPAPPPHLPILHTPAFSGPAAAALGTWHAPVCVVSTSSHNHHALVLCPPGVQDSSQPKILALGKQPTQVSTGGGVQHGQRGRGGSSEWSGQFTKPPSGYFFKSLKKRSKLRAQTRSVRER